MLKKPWLRFDFFISALASIVSAALAIALAFFLMAIVDAATEGNWRELIIALILTVAVAAGELVIEPIARYFGYRYVKHHVVLSKNALYKSSLSGFKSKTEGDIAKYSTDANMIYDNFYLNHTLIVGAVTRFAFSVVGIVLIDWRLFLAALVSSLLPMVAPGIFSKKITKAVSRYSEKSKKYIDYANDSFEGAYEIKSFHAQSFFTKKHDVLNNDCEGARLSSRMVNFMQRATTNFLGSFVFISIIGVGGLLTIQGFVTIGALIAVVQLLNGVVSPISQIAAYIGEMKGTKNLADSYFIKPQKDDGYNAADFSGSIRAENISFAYPQEDKPTLSGFSVDFAKGGTYAIIGESGCGKSTLAKILAGVLHCDEGAVLFDGVDTKTINMDSYSKRVKYIHQFTHLFDMPIKENIDFGLASSKLAEFIEGLGLGDIYAQSDEREQISSREGVSGGQKQRIALARALNSMPDVLILDEPTASLDVESAIAVIKYLKSINGLTLIIITHADNPELIKMFDGVIEMKAT